MKKLLAGGFALLLAASLITGCSKKDDSSNPTSPSQNVPADLPTTSFLQTATGGDVRGTYYPNNPVFNLFYPSLTGISLKSEIKSTSTGSVTFQGSTAQSGTYTTDNLTIAVLGSITLSVTGLPDQTIPLLINEKPNSKGTWAVSSTGTIVLDNTDTVKYAVGNNGMFWITGVNYSVAGTDIPFSAVIAFKKQ